MFQTLRPRDEIEGSGMGLALVKKIVETYGGKTSIASDGVRGTSIDFTWPVNIEGRTPIANPE
jgi:signal transduction histidine kinase